MLERGVHANTHTQNDNDNNGCIQLKPKHGPSIAVEC